MTRAQYELVLNAVEKQRAVQVNVVAAVANAYVTVLADGAQAAVAAQTLDAQIRSYQLTRCSTGVQATF